MREENTKTEVRIVMEIL